MTPKPLSATERGVIEFLLSTMENKPVAPWYDAICQLLASEQYWRDLVVNAGFAVLRPKSYIKCLNCWGSFAWNHDCQITIAQASTPPEQSPPQSDPSS